MEELDFDVDEPMMLGSDEEFEFSDEECTSEEEEDDDDVQEGKERAHSDLTIHIVPLL